MSTSHLTLPAPRSRRVAITDDLVISDRDGREYGSVGNALVRSVADWDIDRPGSKGRVDIEAHQGVLQPGMWVSRYRTITPEVGEPLRVQRGHFKLGRPGMVYDGAMAIGLGTRGEHQKASGSELPDEIAGVRLAESFYTPVGGHVMSDVKALIQLATVGAIGPNLLPQGGFEDGVTGWQFSALGMTQARSFVSAYSTPEGNSVYRANIAPLAPVGSLVRATTPAIPIPAGAERLMISGLALGPVGQTRYAYIEFFNGVVWVGRIYAGGSGGASARLFPLPNVWHREIGVGRIRDDAVSFRVGVVTESRVPINEYTISQWDDVQVRVVTNDPLPDDRFSLPPSDAVASTRIQTSVGKSILYDAINGDRLGAISHHALSATMEGRLTAYPLRSVATATPLRVYGPGDIRITSPVEIIAAGGDVPNRFPAIKESFEDDVAPLYTTADNMNPHDPFSIVSTGQVRDAEPIMVPDAVSMGALQAVADAARDRFSTQEAITFAVQFDPYLTVYDIVQIDDPAMPLVNGNWAVESIREDGPELFVSARRAIGGGQ